MVNKKTMKAKPHSHSRWSFNLHGFDVYNGWYLI